MGRGWVCCVGEGLESGTGAKRSRKKVFHPLKTVKWEIKPPCELRKSGKMLGWDWAGKSLVVRQPWARSLFLSGKRREGTGKGQAGLVLDLPSIPGSCVLGRSRRDPRPEGAVAEVLARAVGRRQAPAKHAFQSVVSGRICSGTIYFPIVTDGASVAGPMPCSGGSLPN